MTIVTRTAYGAELPYSVLDANWTEIETRLAFNESGFAALNTNYSNVSTSLTNLTSSVSAQDGLRSIHPCYFFHGYAGNQGAGDSVMFDLTGCGNHAMRGANLSDAEMFANAGYVTTKAPANPYDICLRIPNLNFDYSIGEKLFIWWRGKITPEANERAFMGDGYTSQRGIQIRVNQTGKLTAAIFGATATVASLSTAIPFDGNLHDIGVYFDGATKTHGYWIDGVMDSSFAGALATLGATAYDTKNSSTFNLGAAYPASGTATAPQSGIATQTKALVILRLGDTYPSPSVATLTNVCKSLRTDPGKLLLASAL